MSSIIAYRKRFDHANEKRFDHANEKRSNSSVVSEEIIKLKERGVYGKYRGMAFLLDVKLNTEGYVQKQVGGVAFFVTRVSRHWCVSANKRGCDAIGLKGGSPMSFYAEIDVLKFFENAQRVASKQGSLVMRNPTPEELDEFNSESDEDSEY